MKDNPERLEWYDYFMAMAMLAAKRSPDPSTQVGCILVRDKRIIATAYNGYAPGVEPITWNREPGAPYLESKYTYVVHAEQNAIANCAREGVSTIGSIAYVTLFPCVTCANMMIAAGVEKIIYLDKKYYDMDFSIAARKVMDAAEPPVTYHEFSGNFSGIYTDF